ncbi:filensin isoform X3 [Anolis carolinensis]|uniref:filensin isoform X3 n=1 Tax=Anolis carolinensis TaxID=28377 RepID=UPI0007DB7D2A|nr:PREDICTED: filensin isoform X2 [Anolis carolinensis]|eukprot:XP_016851219.1 PREDICTED: filensin isoform X2 [Anolis carolinensis]
MYRSSFLREIRKEKYERSDTYEELPESSEFGSLAQAQGLENLQELNERFGNYINRARVLEQRNAILRKQLETFQRMEELSGLEEAFTAQIDHNRQRVRELGTERSKLSREEKDAQRMLDEFRNKYRNECEYQQMLKTTLEQLNKEADEALLRNLELQIELQFLQDDANSTKDRYKKDLMEIQTYVSILQQIVQTIPRVSSLTGEVSEERLITERKIPILQGQLEEYKSVLCQLQAQKIKLQTETTMLEQAIKSTQESYEDEIQLYNEQIDTLRKGIEEAERTLEKYTNDCRQLSIYKQSLENELERYKRIIENEDSRLNSAIVGTPVTLFTPTYRPPQAPTLRGRGEITVSDSEGKMLNEKDVQLKPELPEPFEHDKGEPEAYETPEGPKSQEDIIGTIPTAGIQEYRPERKEKEDVAEQLEKPEEKGAEAGVYVSKEYDREISFSFKDLSPPNIMSYEKVEMMESIEKFSDDKVQSYEETAMVVETMIEKTSKKRMGDKSS